MIKAAEDEESLERAPVKSRARSSKPKRNASAYKSAVDQVRDRFVGNPQGDWKDLKPSTLLGLYAVLHEKVYGVLPDELADDWYPASATAKKFLETNQGRFDIPAFMRWVWQRERRSREQNPEREFRVGWRYQFSQKLVTDYRVAKGG